MRAYNLDEVYGISRDIPLNYVSRRHVDELFMDSLDRNKHIIVYGGSKQGKTCLRKKSLSEGSYINVQCSNKLNIASLYGLILKSAGFELVESETKAISGALKVRAILGFKFLLNTNVESAVEGGINNQKKTMPLELDLSDVNDVILALDSIPFKKKIVLDDFHYLSFETQREFAIALKAFYECSKYTFIIVGVWLEDDRLIALNGDLAGRVTLINVDDWSEEDLLEVITKGENLLNIEFDPVLKDQIIEESYDSVYLIQETCHRVCQKMKISKTLPDTYFIPKSICKISDIVKDAIIQHNARYHSFISLLSEGFENIDPLIYKCILYSILSIDTDDLRKGLKLNKIQELALSKLQSTALSPSNIKRALQLLQIFQIKNNILPNILDYDHTNLKLNVVDKGFIIWLNHQDRKELFELAGIVSENE